MTACLLLAVSGAQAHRVNVFCWVDSEEVVCESTFAGGGPVKSGRIEVRAESSGRLLLTGTTDAKGRYRFLPPQKAREEAWDLKVTSIADMGHKGSWTVRGGEYAAAKRSGPGNGETDPEAARSGPQAGTQMAEPRGTGASAQEVEQALSRALQEELAPIRKSLAELRRDRISLQDVLGGLGYILGLTGIALFFAAKRR